MFLFVIIMVLFFCYNSVADYGESAEETSLCLSITGVMLCVTVFLLYLIFGG